MMSAMRTFGVLMVDGPMAQCGAGIRAWACDITPTSVPTYKYVWTPQASELLQINASDVNLYVRY